MTIEIVDLPSYKMVIFYSYVSLPEGTTGSFSQYKHRAAVAGSDFPMERSRTAPTAATTVMAASLSRVPMTHVTRERWWSSWADKTCETWWNYGEIMVKLWWTTWTSYLIYKHGKGTSFLPLDRMKYPTLGPIFQHPSEIDTCTSHFAKLQLKIQQCQWPMQWRSWIWISYR